MSLVTVNVDLEEILEELDADEILDEFKRRGMKLVEFMDVDDIVARLQDDGGHTIIRSGVADQVKIVIGEREAWVDSGKQTIIILNGV